MGAFGGCETLIWFAKKILLVKTFEVINSKWRFIEKVEVLINFTIRFLNFDVPKYLNKTVKKIMK